MKFFALAFFGAVASASDALPRLAELGTANIVYTDITSSTECLATESCTDLAGKEVSHADFDTCLKNASNKCDFTAKAKNIFTTDYKFETVEETDNLGFCSSTTEVAPITTYYGYNVKNIAKFIDLAQGTVTTSGTVKVTMDKAPATPANLLVKSGAWIDDCPQTNGFELMTAVEYTAVEDSTYEFTIAADKVEAVEGLYFNNAETTNPAATFTAIDFSGLVFDVAVKGKHNTEGAYGLFASSALAGLVMTYFAF